LNTGIAALNYTVNANAAWLSVTPASGMGTGETDTVDVTYDTASLATGSYGATISVADAAAGNSPQNITVNLDVHSYGDLDMDGDVDQSDFGKFQACLFLSPLPPECADADHNADNQVDTTDLSQFLPCMAGANQPPGC
jgi:hypothetical protein